MGEKIIVTGAGRGIGKAIALAGARAGFDVTVHYNASASAAEDVKSEIEALGGAAQLIRFDVTNREECERVLEEWVSVNGAPWGVVSNAGICADDSFPAMSGEKWDAVLRTDLDSFYNVLHPLTLPMARKKRGRIITIASVSGVMGNRGQVNYSAAKAGIIGATKSLAVELASRTITVNCIAPGVIETDMIKDAPMEYILPQIPLGRPGKAEEVAALAVFLLSPEASYITRQVININGGMI